MWCLGVGWCVRHYTWFSAPPAPSMSSALSPECLVTGSDSDSSPDQEAGGGMVFARTFPEQHDQESSVRWARATQPPLLSVFSLADFSGLMSKLERFSSSE